jgi:type IV secretion system protein VirB6
MASPFVTTLSFVDSTCATYIQSGVSNMAKAIEPAAVGLTGVYVMLWGFAHLAGLIHEPIMDATKRLIKVGFILGIALNLGTYNSYVTDTVLTAPGELAAVISGNAGVGNMAASLDQMFSKFWSLGTTFWDTAGITNGYIGYALAAIFCWVVGAIVTGYAAFLIVLAKIGTAIIIALGPVFIISAMFSTTRRFFEVWVQQLANYGLVNVLVIALNVFLFQLLEKYLTATQTASNNNEVVAIMPVMLVSIVCMMLLTQVMGLASGLAGGIALSDMGVGRWGGNKAGAAGQRAAKAAAAGTAGAVTYTARKAIQKFQPRQSVSRSG